jgi:hypothetical protein
MKYCTIKQEQDIIHYMAVAEKEKGLLYCKGFPRLDNKRFLKDNFSGFLIHTTVNNTWATTASN